MPEYPEHINDHAIIMINQTTAFFVGGNQGNGPLQYSNKTYYLNVESSEWKRGTDLKTGRMGHTTGVLVDHITNSQIAAVVAGKNTSEYSFLSSTEFLGLGYGQMNWTQGIFNRLLRTSLCLIKF